MSRAPRRLPATNHWRNTVNRDFPTFSCICIFFLLTLSLPWSSLFFSPSLTVPTSAFPSVHIVGSLTSKLPSIICLSGNSVQNWKVWASKRPKHSKTIQQQVQLRLAARPFESSGCVANTVSCSLRFTSSCNGMDCMAKYTPEMYLERRTQITAYSIYK